jgi:hypothetical protein
VSIEDALARASLFGGSPSMRRSVAEKLAAADATPADLPDLCAWAQLHAQSRPVPYLARALQLTDVDGARDMLRQARLQREERESAQVRRRWEQEEREERRRREAATTPVDAATMRQLTEQLVAKMAGEQKERDRRQAADEARRAAVLARMRARASGVPP